MIHFLNSFFKLPTCLYPTKTQCWISHLGHCPICSFPPLTSVSSQQPKASFRLHLSSAQYCSGCPLSPSQHPHEGTAPVPSHFLCHLHPPTLSSSWSHFQSSECSVHLASGPLHMLFFCPECPSSHSSAQARSSSCGKSSGAP